jgi:hypothetical protein
MEVSSSLYGEKRVVLGVEEICRAVARGACAYIEVLSFGSEPAGSSRGRSRRASAPEEVFRQESASLSPPAMVPAVPDGNCVTVRWGGEQPKGNGQSVG